jgi:hypothetical protein
MSGDDCLACVASLRLASAIAKDQRVPFEIGDDLEGAAKYWP